MDPFCAWITVAVDYIRTIKHAVCGPYTAHETLSWASLRGLNISLCTALILKQKLLQEMRTGVSPSQGGIRTQDPSSWIAKTIRPFNSEVTGAGASVSVCYVNGRFVGYIMTLYQWEKLVTVFFMYCEQKLTGFGGGAFGLVQVVIMVLTQETE
jgi:hypothetical protein